MTSAPFYKLGKTLDNIFVDACENNSGKLDPNISFDVNKTDLENASDFRLSREMAAYVLASNRSAGDWIHLSLQLDKSRVFGRGFWNLAFALPDNTAWWAPPQD